MILATLRALALVIIYTYAALAALAVVFGVAVWLRMAAKVLWRALRKSNPQCEIEDVQGTDGPYRSPPSTCSRCGSPLREKSVLSMQR